MNLKTKACTEENKFDKVRSYVNFTVSSDILIVNSSNVRKSIKNDLGPSKRR